MKNPVASRFLTARTSSKPEEKFSAPVHQGDAEYDFRLLLQTMAEAGDRYYTSLSDWDAGHSSWAHAGTTCITLAYKSDVALEVRELLEDADLLHYEFQIKQGLGTAVMFAFPTTDHFNHTDTTRAASLLAHNIGIKGVIENSYLSTFFFRFAKLEAPEVRQAGTTQLNETIIEDNNGVFVRMKEWLA